MIDPREKVIKASDLELKNQEKLIADDNSDEEIVDDSGDLEALNEIICDDECQINEAFDNAISDLVSAGYDLDQLFDPSWK